MPRAIIKQIDPARPASGNRTTDRIAAVLMDELARVCRDRAKKCPLPDSVFNLDRTGDIRFPWKIAPYIPSKFALEVPGRTSWDLIVDHSSAVRGRRG